MSYYYYKTPNFREHLIFAQIREGVGQGGSGAPIAALNGLNCLNYGPIFKILKVACSLGPLLCKKIDVTSEENQENCEMALRSQWISFYL